MGDPVIRTKCKLSSTHITSSPQLRSSFPRINTTIKLKILNHLIMNPISNNIKLISFKLKINLNIEKLPEYARKSTMECLEFLRCTH